MPHYQHPVLAKEAFAQGLHVMREKPAGVYTKAVREMNEAAKESGSGLCMMFNQHQLRLTAKMREMVQTASWESSSGQLDHHRLVPHSRSITIPRLARHLGGKAAACS